MWFQFVTGAHAHPAITLPSNALVGRNVNSLLLYEPLQLAAIMEQVWRSRYNANSTQFAAWPEALTRLILGSKTDDPWIIGYDFSSGAPKPIQQGITPPFVFPYNQPGIGVIEGSGNPTIWDHLIFAYITELTNIEQIFRAVIDRVAFSEELGNLTPQSRRYWRTTEWLISSEALSSSLLTSGSRLGRDDLANRRTLYYWMFGADLPNGRDYMDYEKPFASNRDFFPTLEAFLREVWIGIENAKNTSGTNPEDPTKISILARRLFDMMLTRRLNGQLSREEFTAVSKMSWMSLVLMSNNFVIRDLQCEASDPSERLANIARKVNMTSHLRSKFLFDLAQPLSFLMQAIEMGSFNTPVKAATLYELNQIPQVQAELVIDNYSIASNVDLKSKPTFPVELTKPPPARLPPPPRGRPGSNGAVAHRSTS